jgi:PAS domain S-box-containing protein
MGPTESARTESRQGAIEPEAILHAVIAMSDDAIFTTSRQGDITSWSATAERLFGRPADDVLDGPLDDLFPPHLSDEVHAVLTNVLKGDRIRHFETELQRPDGMPSPVSLSFTPVLDAANAPIGAVVIVRDVTEQHLAQASLAEIDARLEEGEALAHIGSWLWDLRTGAVQWSAEFYRIHGVDPLDFDGTVESHLGLIETEDREAVRAAMVESVESGRRYNGEYRIVQPGGGVRTIQVRAQPTFGSTGRAVGLRGIGQDVTPPAAGNATG